MYIYIYTCKCVYTWRESEWYNDIDKGTRIQRHTPREIYIYGERERQWYNDTEIDK